MRKRVRFVVLCFVFLSVAPLRADERRTLPNVVFFLADDAGYGDVGIYGGVVPTPNIDRLARDGMRFTDAHSPAALCAPSCCPRCQMSALKWSVSSRRSSSTAKSMAMSGSSQTASRFPSGQEKGGQQGQDFGKSGQQQGQDFAKDGQGAGGDTRRQQQDQGQEKGQQGQGWQDKNDQQR